MTIVKQNPQILEIDYSLKREIPLKELSIYPQAKRTYLDYHYVVKQGNESQRVAVIYSQVITHRLQQLIKQRCDKLSIAYIVV